MSISSDYLNGSRSFRANFAGLRLHELKTFRVVDPNQRPWQFRGGPGRRTDGLFCVAGS